MKSKAGERRTYAKGEKGDECDGMRAESPVELSGSRFEVGHSEEMVM
jgi:hypothetical protein